MGPIFVMASAVVGYASLRLLSSLKIERESETQSHIVGEGQAIISDLIPPEPAVLEGEIPEEESVPGLFLPVTTVGLTVGGVMLWSPLYTLGALAMGGQMLGMWWRAAQSMKRTRRISWELVDTGVVSTVFLSGHPILATLAYLEYAVARHLSARVRIGHRGFLKPEAPILPERVWILKDGVDIEVHRSQLQPGDILKVEAGQLIPADGYILHMPDGRGDSPSPSDLKGMLQGLHIAAGTKVEQGFLYLQVAAPSDMPAPDAITTTPARGRRQSPVGDRLADEISGISVLLGLAALPLVGPVRALGCLFIFNGDSVKVLVHSNTLLHQGLAARDRVWIKEGRAIENAADIDTLFIEEGAFFDPQTLRVRRLDAFQGLDRRQLLALVAAVALQESTPHFQALLMAARQQRVEVLEAARIDCRADGGLYAHYRGQRLLVGERSFIEEAGVMIPIALYLMIQRLEDNGRSYYLVAQGELVVGLIEFQWDYHSKLDAFFEDLEAREIEVHLLLRGVGKQGEHYRQRWNLEHIHTEVDDDKAQALVEGAIMRERVVAFLGGGGDYLKAQNEAHVALAFQDLGANLDGAQVILLENHPNGVIPVLDLGRSWKAHSKALAWVATVPEMLAASTIVFAGGALPWAMLLASTHLWIGAGILAMPALLYRRKGAKKSPTHQPNILTILEGVLRGDFTHASQAEREESVQQVIHASSLASAAVSLAPVPFIDTAMMSPIQLGMVGAIARIYGHALDRKAIVEIGGVLATSMILRAGTLAATKLVPIAGHVVGASVAYATTWALGEACDAYYRHGRALDGEELKSIFKASYERGLKVWQRIYKEKEKEKEKAVATH